ncbi:MAG: hypothetical protein C5B49_05735 [Bdellovibrio sp.]|nr:MAG: hypothetical protein C5B49_05735 [Bdellovibrio sp.]
MTKIMILQHVAREPVGTLIPLLKSAGFRLRFVNFARTPHLHPRLEGYSGLVVLGGPMGVYETERFEHLKIEMKLIEEALKRELPVLGICLGSQLMARVLGSPVRKASCMEFGWYPLQLTSSGIEEPLFSGFKPAERVFQFHQDNFDHPRSAEHLARTEIFEGQAFRYGKTAFGLQFHLEVDRAMIERWLNHPDHEKLLIEHGGGPFHRQKIASETECHLARSMQLSRNLFGKFIELFATAPSQKELSGSKFSDQAGAKKKNRVG